ncbi:MAG: phosphatidylglycerol lysyltransferase domain-containing protein [Acidobacteriota bacterium]
MLHDQQAGEPAPAPFALAMARRYAIVALRVALPLLVVFLVWDELSRIDVHAVRQLLAALPRDEIALALTAAFAAVACAGLYDVVAFPNAGSMKAVKRWGFGTVVACWTNFLAVGPLGGPALRFYVYRRAGLETSDVGARLANLYTGMFSGFAGWVVAAVAPLGDGAVAFAGRVGLAFAAAPLCSVVIREVRHRLRWGRRDAAAVRAIPLALLGAADWGIVALVFVLVARISGVLLPGGTILWTMMAGHAAGFASMVPGGLGTADVTWIMAFTNQGVDADRAAATVLLFRVVLYVVPWFAALIALYLYGARKWRAATIWQRRAIAAAVVVNAGFLLAASALPSTRSWLGSVGAWLPVGVVEVSHSFSILGAITMLFLARGIYRGYRAAFLGVTSLLAGSVLSHFLRGSAPEASVVALVLLLMLLGTRHAFDRRGRIPIRGEYFLAVAVGSLTFFVLMGMLGFGDVPYASALWTRFEPGADAARFLRGTLIAGAVVLAFAVRQSVRPPTLAVYPGADEIDGAIRFIQANDDQGVLLSVGCGDKAIWWHGDDGLAVYQRRGDKMIVLGHPACVKGMESAVLADLVSHAAAVDLELVFYQVGPPWTDLLRDYGFGFFKLGEEAVVDVADYSLAGGKRAKLRRTVRKTEEAGVRYAVFEPPIEAWVIEQAGQVSDTWLADKRARELQFSVGYFSPAYLRRFPIGAAIDAQGRMLAFVNLLGGRAGGEITTDFIRYRGDAITDVMEYVLAKSFLWASEHGFSTFSLGMAPLFDVGGDEGSSFPEKLARQVFLHGEHFYNYQGLHSYKEKFHPDWHPRYLAYQAPWDWAGSTAAVMNLVRARARSDRRRIRAARHQST